jgi:quercetin dioxygenase-like cupin family protein
MISLAYCRTSSASSRLSGSCPASAQQQPIKRTGDVVWFPPGLQHWHEATPTAAMTHTAVQETVDGKNVDWMEKVSDEQYRK